MARAICDERAYRAATWSSESRRAARRLTFWARLNLRGGAARSRSASLRIRARQLARKARIAIAPDTGPEAIAGSTRLKAGTAQKMVLNMLSTAAMVRLGRVYENWMVHVALTNQKLRRRGARILEEAAGVSLSAAEHALRQAGHDLPVGAGDAEDGSQPVAKRSSDLAAAGGNVRQALEAAKKHANANARGR